MKIYTVLLIFCVFIGSAFAGPGGEFFETDADSGSADLTSAADAGSHDLTGIADSVTSGFIIDDSPTIGLEEIRAILERCRGLMDGSFGWKFIDGHVGDLPRKIEYFYKYDREKDLMRPAIKDNVAEEKLRRDIERVLEAMED